MSSISADVKRVNSYSGRWVNNTTFTLAAGGFTQISSLVTDGGTVPIFNCDVGTSVSTTALRHRTDLKGFQVPVSGNYVFSAFFNQHSANVALETSINILSMPAFGTVTTAITNSNVGAYMLARSGLCTTGIEGGCSGSAFLPAGAVIGAYIYTNSTNATTIPASSLIFSMTFSGN